MPEAALAAVAEAAEDDEAGASSAEEQSVEGQLSESNLPAAAISPTVSPTVFNEALQSLTLAAVAEVPELEEARSSSSEEQLVEGQRGESSNLTVAAGVSSTAAEETSIVQASL